MKIYGWFAHFAGVSNVIKGFCFCVLNSELVEMVPTEYSDDLTKRTNEAVALRCLEDLCGIASADDNVPSVQNKIEIDLSRSCEDVLQQILQQVVSFDLLVF